MGVGWAERRFGILGRIEHADRTTVTSCQFEVPSLAGSASRAQRRTGPAAEPAARHGNRAGQHGNWRAQLTGPHRPGLRFRLAWRPFGRVRRVSSPKMPILRVGFASAVPGGLASTSAVCCRWPVPVPFGSTSLLSWNMSCRNTEVVRDATFIVCKRAAGLIWHSASGGPGPCLLSLLYSCVVRQGRPD
jgi:hypothetical protein